MNLKSRIEKLERKSASLAPPKENPANDMLWLKSFTADAPEVPDAEAIASAMEYLHTHPTAEDDPNPDWFRDVCIGAIYFAPDGHHRENWRELEAKALSADEVNPSKT